MYKNRYAPQNKLIVWQQIANHCYEEVDLDDIVRISNEFSFPIASFQHASEAWLVPDVLKRTYVLFYATVQCTS